MAVGLLGETEETLALLDKGADIHAMNDLGLRWAIYEGNIDTVKALLARGAMFPVVSQKPLGYSAENSHFHARW
jgi:hypothetical protein